MKTSENKAVRFSPKGVTVFFCKKKPIEKLEGIPPGAGMLSLFLIFLGLVCLAHADPRVFEITIENQSSVPVDVRPVTVDPEDGITVLSTNTPVTIAAGASHPFGFEIATLGDPYVRFQYYAYTGETSTVGNSLVGADSGAWTFTGIVYYSWSPAPEGSPPYTFTEIVETDNGPTPVQNKTLWVVDDSTMTADLYREGVDKIVYGLQTVAAASGGGGGGGGGGGSTTHSESVASSHEAALALNPDSGDIAAASSAGQTAIGSAITDSKAVFNPGSVSAPTSVDLTLSFSVNGHPYSINCDPMANGNVAALANWIKGSLAWIVVALFNWGMWTWFQKVYFEVARTAPAKGNPVVGGTGAQATSLVVAVAITGVLAALPTTFWAMVDSNMAFASLVTDNPFALGTNGNIQKGIYLANCFIPLQTIMSAFASQFLIQKGGMLIVAVAQTVVRYVVA